MRSLLIAPADEKRLAEALEERRGRNHCRSRPGRAGRQGRGAGRGGAVSERRRAAGAGGPALIVRTNALDSGETDSDLDAVMAHAPDAILLPGSLGAASVQQLSAKLAVREAEFALPDGGTRIIAVADTAQSLFNMGSYRGSSARLIGVAWSCGGLARRYRGRDGPRPPWRLRRSLSPGARLDAACRDVSARGGDRRALRTTCATRRVCAPKRSPHGATALPAKWRSTRPRLASSTRYSRRDDALTRRSAPRRRRGVEPCLLNRRLARFDLGHPLLGVLRPRAHDLDVFRTVTLHKICAGNHRLRIECAHHWIVDGRAPDHVNGRLRLTIRV